MKKSNDTKIRAGTQVKNVARGLTAIVAIAPPWSDSLWLRDFRTAQGKPASDLNQFEAVPVLDETKWEELPVPGA